MRLKEFITRSGGVITAIALLASMVVVAGAAPSAMTCSICDKIFGYWEFKEGVTYQEFYNVGDIPNLYNSGGTYVDDNLDVAIYNDRYICESCLEKIVTDYKANHHEGTSVDPATGSASVPVNVTREAAIFSVVVPTTLPIAVDADGNVTTATDATIINNSGAPVAVTKVELTSQSNWTLAAYSRDILNLPVDAKQFGLQMNIGDKTVATSNSGTSDILSDSLNAQIAKGQNCAVTYNALFPARTAAVSDTQIANVVFTVGWA